MFMDTKEIIEDGAFGEIPCQIAPIGEFYGSDKDGNAIKETLTPESLQDIANKLNESREEILCDKDHASVKAGADRDTHAQGWFSRFFIDPLKGLMGWLKLTKSGRDSIENREYRFLSPVFSLDESHVPTRLHSVAMTNCAALPVEPILNTEPKDILTMEITKEELVSLIKETMIALNSEPVKEEVVENSEPKKVCNENNEVVEDEEVKDSESSDEPKEECVESNEVVDIDEGETISETPVENDEVAQQAEKVGEEVLETLNDVSSEESSTTDEPSTSDEQGEEVKPLKKEVIKEEVLNSSPSMNVEIKSEPKWKSLHGDAFWEYLKKHPNGN